ncbi:hypothetical protein D3C83_139000 [compost metagenome]
MYDAWFLLLVRAAAQIGNPDGCVLVVRHGLLVHDIVVERARRIREIQVTQDREVESRVVELRR